MISQIDYWAIPYASRNEVDQNADLAEDPVVQLQSLFSEKFATTSEDIVVIAEPSRGNWVYMAVIKFVVDGETKFRSSKQLRKPLLEVVSTDWTETNGESPTDIHPRFLREGEHSKNVKSGHVFYPEALTPGGNPESVVGLELNIRPSVLEGFSPALFLHVKDPDNALDGDIRDKNDNSQWYEGSDNYQSTENHSDPKHRVNIK